MFYILQGLMKKFSAGFLISVSLSATDLLCLIKNLIFNSLKFKLIAFKRRPSLLAIPMILESSGDRLLGRILPVVLFAQKWPTW